ncbi:MAG: DUF3857 domain-containing protein [Bacteroidetes bacterium]|nr:DUF3857 domain-containing protein [Bacteroidota bacterium]
MKTCLSLVFLFLFVNFSFSQEDIKLKWGKVSNEELQMTSYDADPNAGAVVLADVGEITFDFTEDAPRFRLERHRRVKILDRSGFDEGDIQIYFYSYSKQEDIDNLKVQVFSPDGEKVVVDKDNVFEEEETDHWSVIKIAVPNLQVGSVIEYRYTLDSERIFSLEPWQFQEDIPVLWSEINLQVPEWLNYIYMKQSVVPHLEESDQIRRTMRLPRTGYDTMGSEHDRGYQSVEALFDVMRIVMKDVPALKEESYITTMQDYYAQIKFQLRTVEFPGSQIQSVLTTWSQVCLNLEQSEAFGQQLEKTAKYKNAWKACQAKLSKDLAPSQKVLAIYDFLAARVRWDGTRGMYIENKLDDVFERGSGSSGEINLLLIALLKEAGLDAYPMLVSTRSHGQMIEQYPFIDQFNHVFVAVLIGQDAMLLDLGNPLLPAGQLHVETLNGRALLVNSANPIWISIPVTPSKGVYYSNLSVDENGHINGTMKTSEEGYSAYYSRSALIESSVESAWQSAFEERFPGCSVAKLSLEGKENVYEKLKEEISFDFPNGAQQAGAFIYVNPVVYSGFTENPFSLGERSYPVNIPYPIEDKYIYNLSIPEGFVIEELPEPTRILMDGNGGLFQYNISEREGGVQVIIDIKVNKLIYNPEEYSVIKGFFDIAIEKLNEPVVLKKG